MPTDKKVYATFKTAKQLPANYVHFHPLIYSVENSLPFVKLGEADHWQPDPQPDKLFWRTPILPTTLWVSFAGLLRWYQWFQILSGWLLGTLFIAGVTGIIRKD
jgi:hypothetical protein